MTHNGGCRSSLLAVPSLTPAQCSWVTYAVALSSELLDRLPGLWSIANSSKYSAVSAHCGVRDAHIVFSTLIQSNTHTCSIMARAADITLEHTHQCPLITLFLPTGWHQ